jgi:iron complex outermembrane receptor protein
VRSLLRVLNPNSATFEDADPASVQDIPPLRPTLTHTLEAGYKGDVGERVRVAANVYYERRRDFIGTPVVETPSVFLATGDVNQPGTLAGYLARFLPAEEARRIALLVGGVSGSRENPGITLGTVSPEGPYAGTDILLTYRNFGALSRWGLDGSAEIAFLDAWTVNTTFSWTTRNLFPKEEVGGLADIALNAPKHKGSLALHYRDAERGLSGSVAGRHVDGFPMRSGVFVGTVPSYRIVDAGLAYRFGPGRAWLLSANVQNLLDERHREFVGAPALGRAAAVTLQWTTR